MDRQANMENKISDASLSEYLGDRYEDRQDEICRSKQMCHMLHELVVELHIFKLNTIGELDKELDYTKKAFNQYEKDHPPSKLLGSRYFPIQIVRISMELLYGDFPKLTGRVVDPDKLAEYRNTFGIQIKF